MRQALLTWVRRNGWELPAGSGGAGHEQHGPAAQLLADGMSGGAAGAGGGVQLQGEVHVSLQAAEHHIQYAPHNAPNGAAMNGVHAPAGVDALCGAPVPMSAGSGGGGGGGGGHCSSSSVGDAHVQQQQQQQQHPANTAAANNSAFPTQPLLPCAYSRSNDGP
jgi:hypothetical protein